MPDNASIVTKSFEYYRAQDQPAAFSLYADDFTFSSPQDDRIDRAAFFEKCFPTAARMASQQLLRVTPADDELVFAYYEYTLTTGETYRNVEAITVRGGLIREVRVFFGSN
jgi:ketosteroid isomerase-like protein